jgi:hypothetical protein
MSTHSEKRSGADRRRNAGAPPAGLGERRRAERRQMVIAEISFFQWATQFAAFQRGLAMPKAGHSGDDNETDTSDGKHTNH